MKKGILLIALALVALMYGAGSQLTGTPAGIGTAFAAEACSGSGFVLNPGVDCTVTGAHTLSGTLTFGETLHMMPGSLFNTSGANTTITVDPGSVIMEKGSAITGGGKNITINVPHGNMTMRGTPLAGTDKCGYSTATLPSALPSAADGAQITSVPASLTTTVTINVGNILATPPTGSFVMERCSVISVNRAAASAGAIVINAGHDVDVDGLVLSESSLSGTGAKQAPGGGPITIRTSCELTVSATGVVSSRGQDAGADLVHLEGCDVNINGLVQSTGAGHGIPNNPKNHCDVHPHNVNGTDTGCIEVWAEELTISNTGEVNADISSATSGGPQGTSYIDLFADKEITVTGKTGATDHFSVHADSYIGTDTSPNVITVLSHTSTVSATGKAFSASDNGNGSSGGKVDIEASGKVTLDTATVQASGDFSGGGNTNPAPCAGGTGACGQGGQIIVRSWTGAVSWQPGVADVRPDIGTAPPAGSVSLTACTSIAIVGLNSFNATPSQTITSPCAAGPALPAYVEAAFSGPSGDRAIWANCNVNFSTGTKSGIKFNDLNGNHVRDGSPLEPVLQGWQITLWDATQSALAATASPNPTTTDSNGAYSFTVTFASPTTYVVCETPQSGWTQTAPVAGAGVVACKNGTLGYQFTLTAANPNDSGNDFGNFLSSFCQKQPVQDVLNKTTGQYPGNKGPDYLVHVNHGESVQTAVDAAALAGGDVNGDGYIIVAVTAFDDGTLGGSSNQFVEVKANYAKPFALIGCSVTLTGGGSGAAISITSAANDPGIVIPESAAGASHIFLMDLHGGSSGIGVNVVGNHRYLRNEEPKDNKGAGISITGDSNTVHNGTSGDKGHGNAGDGVYVQGNSNYLTDTNAYANGGNGFNVAGNNNQLLKLDAGDKGKGNTGDGVHVVGDSNLISEPTAFANGGDGVDVTGNGNTVTKADAGEKTKLAAGGTGNGQDGIRVGGTGNNVNQSVANSNALVGFDISGGSIGSPNILASDQSNKPGNSDYENTGAEYLIAGSVTNGGSNRADNVAIPAAAKCPTFPTAGSCE